MASGLGGGTSKTSEKGTQTSTPTAPSWLTTPWQGYSEQAQGLLDPVKVPAPTAVGASPLQKAAYSSAKGLLDFRPIADSDLSVYTNPFESQVVDAATSDLDRARRLAIVGNSAASYGAGANAWLGDRAGVADSETNRGFLDQVASLSANLRKAGFDAATANAMADAQYRLSATQTASDLGDKEKAAQVEADPYTQWIKRLSDFAALLNQVPGGLFTGQTQTKDVSGKESGAQAGFSFS